MTTPRRDTLSRRLIAAAGLLAFIIVPLLSAVPVQAFKPYTHVYTADRAWEDVVADGMVTIEGRDYTVNPRVVTALTQYPDYYRGGTIGPDGFPDLTYGQSVIHPEETGKWLRYVFDKAWEAQTDPAYPTEAERLQILAFAYGYLTHAAGDMWAHTLVNNFALGVFPGVGEILTDADKAAMAIRHVIVEGYIGDATNGYDGNPDRTAIGGDVSDDSTPAVSINAPHNFVYRTLIDPNAPTPSAGRGPVLDAFIALRAQLYAIEIAPNPQPVAQAVSNFNGLMDDLNDMAKNDCNFGSGISDPFDAAADAAADFFVNCPPRLAQYGLKLVERTLSAFWDLVSGTVELAVDALKDAYISAWRQDIDEGLLHWNELGLAISRALFDPQATRNTQNDACFGDENSLSRATCEDGIGIVQVLFHEADPFINQYLLSMAGFPDFVGDLRHALQEIGEVFDTFVNTFAEVLAPIRDGIDAVKAAMRQLILDLVEEATGVDIEQLKSFLTHPSYWINVTSATIQMPGDTTMTLQLFEDDDHEQLDAWLGLGPNHHTGDWILNQIESTRLADDAVFDETAFAAYVNTVTTAKLLLLDSAELNRALGDSLVAQGIIQNAASVLTYPAMSGDAPTNVMFHALTGSDPWLTSIDSDHAWRSNPLPIFCAVGSADCNYSGLAPISRPAELNGGNGQFPIWESCLLRPAFRDLYADWENGSENFPDLNDAPSPDASDPNPPVAALTPSGNVYASGGSTYIGDGHSFTLGATDAVFTASNVNVEYRFYPDGTTPGAWQPLANGGTFSIPADAGDGVWRIDYRSEDPCHTFADESGAGADPMPPATATTTVVLDTTAPVIAIVSPLPDTLFDTDDMSAIDYTVDDGTLGSSVASHTATLDGAAATDGQVLDMFLMNTGVHVIHVTSVDNLGNGSELTWSFEIQATSESLMTNIDRGAGLRLIKDQNVYLRLKVYTLSAAVQHKMRNHAKEWQSLQLMISEIKRYRGKTMDAAYADKITTWAQEIISQQR